MRLSQVVVMKCLINLLCVLNLPRILSGLTPEMLQECLKVLMKSVRYFYPIVTKIGTRRQTVVKLTSIAFYERRMSGYTVVECG